MTRRVIIHCNADRAQGMGHLMRSLTLAEEARKRGWGVTIAGQFGGRAIEHAATLAPNQELRELGLDSPIEELSELLGDLSPQLLHLDSYDSALDSFVPKSVLVSNMQDGEFGRRSADLHVDANLDAELRYRRITETEKSIIGASGTLVRTAVRSLSHTVRTELSAPFRVLIILGGTDPFDLTPRLTQAMSEYADLSLTVICRPEQRPALVDALGSRALQRVEIIPFTGNLPALANSMDIVVTAAGTSVWDFAAAGIPMGIIAVAENQLLGYRACEAHGLGVALGEPPHAELGERVSTLVSILRDRDHLLDISRRGPLTVDGLGAWRVVSAWEELISSQVQHRTPSSSGLDSTMTARTVTPGDAHRLFEWRNDELTRASSRSQEPVTWVDHVAWLSRALADMDRKLLVIERHGEAVATVRWDRRNGRAWEASITLAPTHRGKGIGLSVLTAGEQVFAADQLPAQLLAEIHVSNLASRRLFIGAGYLPHAPADEAGFETHAKWLVP